jgi:arginyl-tRNA synthetase
MADPLVMLRGRFAAALGAALGPEWAGVDPALRAAREPRFGDYQANAAMRLGRLLGRPPREVATAIVGHLDLDGICAPPEIAGPGFVNLRLHDGWLADQAGALVGDGRLGVAPDPRPETVVVEYSAPNIAKELHVGNLRSTVIGDALARLLGFLGHRVIRRNHVGDWGTPFGMLIEHLLDLGGADALADLPIGDLNAFYRQARAKFDADPAFADRARARVVALQGGDPATLALWRLLLDRSRRSFDALYQRLGVLLTDADVQGESAYQPQLGGVVAELEARRLATGSDGAVCVFPPGFTGRDGQPLPLIVRKRDGGYGYGATDLAALRHRVRDLAADRLVYVVGAPQALHFELLFAVARQAGWLAEPRPTAQHVAFGSVLGEDGRILRTRVGESVGLASLLDEAVERAAAVVAAHSDLDPAAQAGVARAVGVGAVKYADLAGDRRKDYAFGFDRMLAMDGNTAPYLQYAVARIRSIFRRAGLDPAALAPSPLRLDTPSERALALALLRFDGAVRAAADALEPHRLATYLFDLAQTFTAFYERCPVLTAQPADLRDSRLALCELTARVLTQGLALLGIQAPERM